jgi:hypothetical protein
VVVTLQFPVWDVDKFSSFHGSMFVYCPILPPSSLYCPILLPPASFCANPDSRSFRGANGEFAEPQYTVPDPSDGDEEE